MKELWIRYLTDGFICVMMEVEEKDHEEEKHLELPVGTKYFRLRHVQYHDVEFPVLIDPVYQKV